MIKLGMGGGVGRRDIVRVPAFPLQSDRLRREFAGRQRVIDPFTRERLNYASGVSDEK